MALVDSVDWLREDTTRQEQSKARRLRFFDPGAGCAGVGDEDYSVEGKKRCSCVWVSGCGGKASRFAWVSGCGGNLGRHRLQFSLLLLNLRIYDTLLIFLVFFEKRFLNFEESEFEFEI